MLKKLIHIPTIQYIYYTVALRCTGQDRKPLKEEVAIPQSLQDQASMVLQEFGVEGGATTEEHMAQMVKA